MARRKKNADETLRVCIVGTEMTPFAKSGGLGDVVGSLPLALKRLGVDVRVVLPRYKRMERETNPEKTYVDSFSVSLGWRHQPATVHLMDAGAPCYLIENDYYFGRDGLYGYGDDFERFAFFSKAVVEMLNYIEFRPHVIHSNDWQTGLVNLYMRDKYSGFLFFQDIRTLFTIHNLKYQGTFGRGVLGAIDLDDGYFAADKLEFYGNISFMKAGLLYADAVSTVSRTYADEIQTMEYGYGMDGLLQTRAGVLHGIPNGIDYASNDPATDSHLYFPFDADHMDGKKKNKAALQDRKSVV